MGCNEHWNRIYHPRLTSRSAGLSHRPPSRRSSWSRQSGHKHRRVINIGAGDSRAGGPSDFVRARLHRRSACFRCRSPASKNTHWLELGSSRVDRSRCDCSLVVEIGGHLARPCRVSLLDRSRRPGRIAHTDQNVEAGRQRDHRHLRARRPEHCSGPPVVRVLARQLASNSAPIHLDGIAAARHQTPGVTRQAFQYPGSWRAANR